MTRNPRNGRSHLERQTEGPINPVGGGAVATTATTTTTTIPGTAAQIITIIIIIIQIILDRCSVFFVVRPDIWLTTVDSRTILAWIPLHAALGSGPN